MTEPIQPSSEHKPLGQRMLAAIMFTDVAGSSKLMGEDEERTMKALHRDLRLISGLCREFKGKVLKLMGDGVLAIFYSGVMAVECAQEIQRQLTEQSRSLEGEDVLDHRIGIHLGDVYVHEDEVMGEGVNIAARLQTEAPGGGICISRALYEVVRRRMSLQTIHRGAKQLHNIREEVHIYQIIVGDDAEDHTVIRETPKHQPSRRRAIWGAGAVILAIIIATQLFPKSSENDSSSSGGTDEILSHEEAAMPAGEIMGDTATTVESGSADVERPSETNAETGEHTVHIKSGDISETTKQDEAAPSQERPFPALPPQKSPLGKDASPPGRERIVRPLAKISALQRFDRNHDGRLTSAEIPIRLRGEIMRFDKNGDDVLDRSEIREMVRQLRDQVGVSADSTREVTVLPRK